MKKFVAIFATVLTLCSCLFTSAYASELITPLPEWDSYIITGAGADMHYKAIEFTTDNVEVVYDVAKGVYKVVTTDGKQFGSKDWMYYPNSGWECQSVQISYEASGYEYPNWMNPLYDTSFPVIYDTNGNVNFGEEPMCDGTSCPANDLDMDNICDDCGVMLTMSLRTSLLDYAIQKHVANGQSIHPEATYWLITENAEGGYSVFLSEYPIEYHNDEYFENTLLSDAGMAEIYVSSVVEMSTGQNGGRGWTANLVVPVPGKGVASNHTIEGFFPIPLWTVVEGVTQGGAKELAETTGGTMTTLTLCGVGLMACLVVFALFGKRWLIFLR